MADKPKFTIQQISAMVEELMGMPCFIILGKDKAAVPAIEAYTAESAKIGGLNTSRCREHRDRIRKWQEDNQAKVKVPD